MMNMKMMTMTKMNMKMMMINLSAGVRKATTLLIAGSTMVGLVAGFTWRFVTESSAASNSDQNANVIDLNSQTMSEVQLVEYANQLAIERQRLIAYRLELEALINQMYTAQGIKVPADLKTNSKSAAGSVALRAAAVPRLAKPVQGNSSGS